MAKGVWKMLSVSAQSVNTSANSLTGLFSIPLCNINELNPILANLYDRDTFGHAHAMNPFLSRFPPATGMTCTTTAYNSTLTPRTTTTTRNAINWPSCLSLCRPLADRETHGWLHAFAWKPRILPRLDARGHAHHRHSPPMPEFRRGLGCGLNTLQI